MGQVGRKLSAAEEIPWKDWIVEYVTGMMCAQYHFLEEVDRLDVSHCNQYMKRDRGGNEKQQT